MIAFERDQDYTGNSEEVDNKSSWNCILIPPSEFMGRSWVLGKRMPIGHARVSTDLQTNDGQVDAVHAAIFLGLPTGRRMIGTAASRTVATTVSWTAIIGNGASSATCPAKGSAASSARIVWIVWLAVASFSRRSRIVASASRSIPSVRTRAARSVDSAASAFGNAKSQTNICNQLFDETVLRVIRPVVKVTDQEI
jgi:hypothetical protein